MPSEDSKPVKKEEVEEEEDVRSLGSILQDRKKKPTNASSPRSRPKPAKVKKEEEFDDDLGKPTPKRNSTIKPDKDKPRANPSPGSRPKQGKIIKEELGDDLHIPISKSNSNTKPDKQQKKKKKKKEEKKVAKEGEQNAKKREKKVYDLPGQKRDPPEERDPLRIFYETLYKQAPGSEMAQFWMMESGLLSKEVAKKIYEKKQKKNQQRKLSSPMKAVIAVKRSTQSVTVKKKTLSSPDLSKKKMATSTKVALKQSTKVVMKQSKKRKIEDGSDVDESDDDDFVLSKKITKKQRAA